MATDPVKLMTLCLILTIFNKATTSCPSNCDCSKETAVDCKGTDIVAFPGGIPTNTETLRIYGTNLIQIPANALANLANLTFVSLLDNTFLTTLPAGLFDNLLKLNTIVINYNKVAFIPDGLFKNLPNLERIYLRQNEITNLPGTTFRNLPKLEYLNLENNKIRSLPAELFDKTVPMISSLYFNENVLTSLPDDFFHSISKSLRSLLLVNNQFHEMPVKALKSIENLEEIDVLGNPLFCNCSIKAFVDWANKSNLANLPTISCLDSREITLSKLKLDDCAPQEKATPTATKIAVVDSTKTSEIPKTQPPDTNRNTETRDSSEDNQKRKTIIIAVSITVVVVVIVIALILCLFHTGILSSARFKLRKNQMMVYDSEGNVIIKDGEIVA